MEKYTYNDWLDGKIILKYDYFIPKGENPILVEWNNFNGDEDILLIKRKQKEIFNERVANLLENYKSTFNKELSSSLEPNEHIRMTVSQIDVIFTGVLSPLEYIPTKYWNVVFSYMELREIQEYYKSKIIRGAEVDYNFINSPSRKFQKLDENNQVNAHTLYLFRKWIETNHLIVFKSQNTPAGTIKAPILGFFCGLINVIEIDKMGETESVAVYCQRICNKFELPYTDRVRQNYNVNETKKLIQQLIEKVLPLIDNKTKNLVQQYLDSKIQPKQNLYG
jgi:hypothetical protein